MSSKCLKGLSKVFKRPFSKLCKTLKWPFQKPSKAFKSYPRAMRTLEISKRERLVSNYLRFQSRYDPESRLGEVQSGIRIRNPESGSWSPSLQAARTLATNLESGTRNLEPKPAGSEDPGDESGIRNPESGAQANSEDPGDESGIRNLEI